jgi:hypothetical protein
MAPMNTTTLDRYRGVPLGAEAYVRPMTVELKAGRFLRLPRRAGSTVTVRSGEVWLTEEDGPRDFVLRAGQSFRLSRHGLALVEAFRDASISVN